VLPQLDAVVFTGGIGENAVAVRAKILEGLDANLGIKVDEQKNAKAFGGVEADVATADSRVHVMVIPTNEESAIAVDTFDIARQQSKK